MKELPKKEYLEKNFSKKGEVEDFTFQTFDVYNTYGTMNPVEGFKKIYNQIKSSGVKPIFVWLGCGTQYLCIVQKTDLKYGSCIIFSYGAPSIIYLRLLDGVWV